MDECEKTNILKGVVDAIATSGLDPVSIEETAEVAADEIDRSMTAVAEPSPIVS